MRHIIVMLHTSHSFAQILLDLRVSISNEHINRQRT